MIQTADVEFTFIHSGFAVVTSGLGFDGDTHPRWHPDDSRWVNRFDLFQPKGAILCSIHEKSIELV